jgi:DNA-binding CsgD family transcriptional regulator
MGAALPSLVRWGLSPDADLVYRTLVSLDTAREGQLAHELGLPHERIREAVRELAEAGAIRRVSSSTRRSAKATGRAVWAARQPNQVVGHLHINRPRALRAASSALNGSGLPAAAGSKRPAPVSNASPAPMAAAVNDEPVPTVEPIAAASAALDPDLIPDNVASGADEAPETAEPDPTPAAATAPAPPLAGAPIWDATGTAETHLVGKVAAAPKPVAAAPKPEIPTQAPPGRAPVPPPQHWHPLPTSWQNLDAQGRDTFAEPANREYPQVTLTPRERAIVELLAQGHTDETAARELDLSRRTVGYALGGLMSRLGVDNRFQLGLALGALRAAVPSPRTRSE